MSTAPTVLLVEADIVVRHPLAEYLRGCGFKVIEASSGDEAKQLLQAPDLGVDIVLADTTAPGSGFELRQWMRSEEITAKIILAGSVQGTVQHAGRICNEGPALSKPYDHLLVLDRIRRILAKRDGTASQ